MQPVRLQLTRCLGLAALSCGLVAAAGAHELTLQECLEGSDFIRHAAMSRDYGMTREAFLERMQSDLVLIQQYPPELRWFVQDEADAELLTGAATLVFDSPQTPEAHQSEFLEACTQHMTSASPEDASEDALGQVSLPR